MKKRKLLMTIIVALLAVGMIGCGSQVDKKTTPTKVPAITLSNGETSITQENQIGGWYYKVFGDNGTGYQACGNHPLAWDYSEHGIVMENIGKDFSVQFSLAPKTVKVTYWNAECAEEYDLADDGMVAEVTQDDNGIFYFKIPTDDAYICMIFAVWNEEDCSGDGTFGLLTEQREK